MEGYWSWFEQIASSQAVPGEYDDSVALIRTPQFSLPGNETEAGQGNGRLLPRVESEPHL